MNDILAGFLLTFAYGIALFPTLEYEVVFRSDSVSAMNHRTKQRTIVIVGQVSAQIRASQCKFELSRGFEATRTLRVGFICSLCVCFIVYGHSQYGFEIEKKCHAIAPVQSQVVVKL